MKPFHPMFQFPVSVTEIRGLWRQARSNTFMKGVALLSSGSAIQNLAIVLFAPILSRLFDPTDFGIAGLVYAVAAVLTAIVVGQYHLAIILPKKEIEAVNILAMCAFIALPVSGLVLIAIFLFRDQMNSMYPAALDWQSYAPLIPLMMLLQGYVYTGRFWGIRRKGYRILFQNQILETAVKIVVQVFSGLGGFGAVGLIGGRLLGLCAAISHMFLFLVNSTRGRVFRVIRWRLIKSAALKHWRFPVFQVPSQLLNNGSGQIAPILLGAFFSITVVGYYWMASRVLDRPAMVFGQHIGRVYYQRASEKKNQGKSIFWLFAKTTTALTALSVPLFLIILLFGQEIFAFVFGEEWRRAGAYAQWIVLSSFGLLIASPARMTAPLFDMQRILVTFETLRIIVTATSIFLAARIGDDLLAIAAFSVVQFVAGISLVMLTALYIRKFERLSMVVP